MQTIAGRIYPFRHCFMLIINLGRLTLTVRSVFLMAQCLNMEFMSSSVVREHVCVHATWFTLIHQYVHNTTLYHNKLYGRHDTWHSVFLDWTLPIWFSLGITYIMRKYSVPLDILLNEDWQVSLISFPIIFNSFFNFAAAMLYWQIG